MKTGITRRRLLVGGAGTAALGAVGAFAFVDRSSAVGATSAAVGARETARRRTGRTVAVDLPADPTTVDLGGVSAATWAYGARLPGREIRVRAGDTLRATLRNGLPDPTTVHWHGLALRNDMDGLPGVTQPPIASGAAMTYEFTVPHAGTHWFHPHHGIQLDRGLYAPLIVEDPAEPGGYDAEWVVVLDDWTDGVGEAPDAILARLRQGMGGASGMNHGSTPGRSGMPGMTMGVGSSALLGGDAGDVRYPYYLVNGRIAAAPETFTAKPGQRIRLRVINAAADTAFRLALAGHRLTVIASDGYPLRPVTGDALLIGMGERYDLIVTAGDGVFSLVAEAEGKQAAGRALLRTGVGTPPPATARPAELDRRVVTLRDLRAADTVAVPETKADRELPLVLGGDMMSYRWVINGRPYEKTKPLPVRQGERVRLTIDNQTMMFHPVHLHGHTFAVRGRGTPGPRKDTVVVRPMERLAVDLVADNPGQWAVHCHNAYHAEVGMMGVLSYRT